MRKAELPEEKTLKVFQMSNDPCYLSAAHDPYIKERPRTSKSNEHKLVAKVHFSGVLLVAHDCGYPLSRHTCRATRVAADFWAGLLPDLRAYHWQPGFRADFSGALFGLKHRKISRKSPERPFF